MQTFDIPSPLAHLGKLGRIEIGAPRFELGTSWSRTKRATRLRYAPTNTTLGAGDQERVKRQTWIRREFPNR
jgi:hypothetical protein